MCDYYVIADIEDKQSLLEMLGLLDLHHSLDSHSNIVPGVKKAFSTNVFSN